MPARRRILARHARPLVEAALKDTRVVGMLGARQVGKSTLVSRIASESLGADVLTFDDQATRAAADQDPTGFVAALRTPAVIDEVQRVPDVLLAIKQRVDRDATPGQFLLTGSANILTAPRIADALTGRAEYLHLWPFTQGELREADEPLMRVLFGGGFHELRDQPVGRGAYAALIAAGGYPESLRRSGKRRMRFFEGYVEAILQRDLTSIARVGDHANVRRLLDALASVSANELNFDALSRRLSIPSNTLRAHLALLETLFLARRIPAWSSNRLSRVVRAPKVYVTDSGLLAHLLGADERRIETDLDIGGMLFETFVVTELLRQADWQAEPVRLFHYRDKEKREVDLVLERRDGTLAGIEVKAAASVNGHDFRGLTYLRDRLGDRFKLGAVLYTGERAVPFGDRLAALPISALWGGAPRGPGRINVPAL